MSVPRPLPRVVVEAMDLYRRPLRQNFRESSRTPLTEKRQACTVTPMNTQRLTNCHLITGFHVNGSSVTALLGEGAWGWPEDAMAAAVAGNFPGIAIKDVRTGEVFMVPAR